MRADSGAVAVGGDIRDSTIRIGLDEEGVRRVFAEELKNSQIAQAAVAEGVDPQIIIDISARIAPGIVSRDQAIVALDIEP